MSFSNLKKLTGAAFVLAACLSAAPSMARPTLLAQENRPPAEGVPQLNRNEPYQQERGSGGSGGRSEMTQEVRGKVTRINGDQVDIRTSGGTVRTYKISEADQERNKIDVGSEVVLTVRGDEVVAISPAGTRNSGSSSSSSSSSSTMRRETTVQQSRPAPAPERPAPYAAPAPEPVRGLW